MALKRCDDLLGVIQRQPPTLLVRAELTVDIDDPSVLGGDLFAPPVDACELLDESLHFSLFLRHDPARELLLSLQARLQLQDILVLAVQEGRECTCEVLFGLEA